MWTIVKEIDTKKRKKVDKKANGIWAEYITSDVHQLLCRAKKFCSNWLGVSKPREEWGRFWL